VVLGECDLAVSLFLWGEGGEGSVALSQYGEDGIDGGVLRILQSSVERGRSLMIR
jgi:hypothetical protein